MLGGAGIDGTADCGGTDGNGTAGGHGGREGGKELFPAGALALFASESLRLP